MSCAGVKGKLWATFVPMEPPPADLRSTKPRGVSIVARDFQTVALYKTDGTFAGIRRPGSQKPIEVITITASKRLADSGSFLQFMCAHAKAAFTCSLSADASCLS